MVDINRATDFIRGIDVGGLPKPIVQMGAGSDAGEIFDKAKTQSQVVGSSVFSFAKGVDDRVREAISDSALLAQLVANKRTSQDADPKAWFAAYSEVLQNVGWVLQDRQWSDYSTSGEGAEVNEHFVEVLTAVLGPGATALAIITATVGALKKMQPDSPWLTIFNRESQKARIARFQIGLVEVGGDSDVFVSQMSCVIQAEKAITQVLFFKFRKEKAKFEADVQKVSLNRAALVELGPAIRAKVRNYQQSYISSIADI